MRKIILFCLFTQIIFESCSICRIVEVYKEDYGKNTHIFYRRINARCPRGSEVKGYNEQHYAFLPYIFDSARNFTYYSFYFESNKVKKMFEDKRGRFYYELDYDSSSLTNLNDIDKAVFDRTIKLGDSLRIRDFRYILNGKQFKLKSEWHPSKGN